MAIGAENRDNLQQAFDKLCILDKENSFEIKKGKTVQMVF
jgi:hypothetical protein